MLPLYVNGKFLVQRLTGVQRYARELLLALDRCLPAGWDGRCELLTPRGAPGLPLTRIAQRPVGPAGVPGWCWEQAVLPWAARRGWLLNLAGSAPALAPRMVCTLHDAAVFDVPEAYTRAFVLWYRMLFRSLARRRIPLQTVSAFSRGRLAATLGVDPATIAVVPNGADHLEATRADASALARLGLVAGCYLLAVGSRARHKNLEALVTAFGKLPAQSDVVLALVGAGHAGVFADTGLATGTESPARLRALGSVDDATLKALYTHAMALVFPSTYEGFGLPPLEAMACGCPVLAARAGALPEVCGDAAEWFDPAAPGALDRALRRLVDDTAQRSRLAAAGRQHALTWRWDDAARALVDRLRPLLDRPGAA